MSCRILEIASRNELHFMPRCPTHSIFIPSEFKSVCVFKLIARCSAQNIIEEPMMYTLLGDGVNVTSGMLIEAGSDGTDVLHVSKIHNIFQ